MAKSTSIVNSLLLMTTLSCFIGATYAVELTFELLDNAKECFYEEITKNQSSILEFQVSLRGDVWAVAAPAMIERYVDIAPHPLPDGLLSNCQHIYTHTLFSMC